MLEKLPRQQCVNVELPVSYLLLGLEIFRAEISQFEGNFYMLLSAYNLLRLYRGMLGRSACLICEVICSICINFKREFRTYLTNF